MSKKHKIVQPGPDNVPRVPVPPPTADLSQPGADDTPPIADAETERLLADMEKQASVSQIDESGADNSVTPPASPVVVKEGQPGIDGPRMVTNIGKNPHRIGGVTVPIGSVYYLTDQDLTNKRLMQKLEYAIKLRVLSRGVSG